MKFGVCLQNYGKNLSREGLIKSAKLAEEVGFDSVWTTDHVLVPRQHADPYGNILDCLFTLAYLGAVTERVSLGTSVLVLPLREPILVAKQLATINYLTNGRLILGTAVGWIEEEFRNLGMNFHNRGRRFEEAIKLIRTLNETESPQFDGRYTRFKDAVFKPAFSQKNGLPIWLGGNSEKVLMRATRLVDGWQPVGLALDSYRSMVEKAKLWLQAKPFTFSLRIYVDAAGTAKPYVGSAGQTRDVISGTVQQVLDKIKAYNDAGLEHLACYFGDVDSQTLERKINQFAKEIMPSFR